MIWCIKSYIIAYVKTQKIRFIIHYVKSTAQPFFKNKINFQKVDQHAGGKWLIHDTKRRKDNQLQSLKLPCHHGNPVILNTYRYSESAFDIFAFHDTFHFPNFHELPVTCLCHSIYKWQ